MKESIKALSSKTLQPEVLGVIGFLGGSSGYGRTRQCYYPLLEPALPHLKCISHITGGGLLENVPRVLPQSLGAWFDTPAWEVPPIFRLVRKTGQVELDEMFRVFNMGLGMMLVCAPENVEEVRRLVHDVRVVGEVMRGSKIILAG